jgi:hypothetical protein
MQWMSTHLEKGNLQKSLRQCPKRFAENHSVHNLHKIYLRHELPSMLLQAVVAAIYIHQLVAQHMVFL